MDVGAEGLKAFDRGDWAAAAGLLREAILRNPRSLKLHYALAIADTNLDLRQEAISEFQWVLANAPAGSTESQTARKWLMDIGVLRTVAAATPPPDDAPPAEKPAEAPDAPGRARVGGQVVWNGSNPPVKISRLQLFLKGIAGTKTQDEYRVLRTDEEGRFEFKNVAPGPYKLVDRIAGTPQWRLRVEVEPGQRLALDLTPDNSTRARDDFPDDN